MIMQIVIHLLFLALPLGGYMLATKTKTTTATIAGVGVIGATMGAVAAVNPIAAFWLGIAGAVGLALGTWRSLRTRS